MLILSQLWPRTTFASQLLLRFVYRACDIKMVEEGEKMGGEKFKLGHVCGEGILRGGWKRANSLAAINYLAVKAEGHYAVRARDRVSHKSSLRLNVPRVITSVTRSSTVICSTIENDENDLDWSRPFLQSVRPIVTPVEK